VIDRGEKFGMIKLGSRTELTVPTNGLSVDVGIGTKVKAGRTVLARLDPYDK
jgi:phosphatidylserine decarboxylase